MEINFIQENPINLEIKEDIKNAYNKLADLRVVFRNRNSFYYDELIKYFRFIVPEGRRILEVGCGDGYVLSALKPSYGLGIDISKEMIKKAENDNDNSSLKFIEADIESVTFNKPFDFIILSDLLSDLTDIQVALENLRSACDENTRIIINYHNMLWEPVLKMSEIFGLKMPQKNSNWLSKTDIDNFLILSGFESVRSEKRILIPKKIPIVSGLINKHISQFPFINKLCFSNFLVIRKLPRKPIKEHSVSIIIPTWNEKGNVRSAIGRIPRFGKKQELIFVEGHSSDGTAGEIKQAIIDYPDKDIKFFVQKGKGKGDAVRLAFAEAKNEILMIMDADLTMPPEDLPKFYNAIASGAGEFINGCRLVYPMEEEAMRFLNMLGNKFFAKAFSWLLNQRIKDTLCGTKVLFKKDYDSIQRNRSYFGDFDPFGDFDLIFGAAKQNLKIIEVPIKYRSRGYGETSISRFSHGWLLLKMTIFAYRKLKSI
jgi:SAM-dependent methyltransferase